MFAFQTSIDRNVSLYEFNGLLIIVISTSLHMITYPLIVFKEIKCHSNQFELILIK